MKDDNKACIKGKKCADCGQVLWWMPDTAVKMWGFVIGKFHFFVGIEKKVGE